VCWKDDGKAGQRIAEEIQTIMTQDSINGSAEKMKMPDLIASLSY